jgi:hypothetical protein
MTQTAVLAGNDQRVNFLNIFIRPKSTSDSVDVVPSKAPSADPILDWFEKSSILEPVEFKSIPAGKIFQSDRTIIKFKLSGIYRDYFVLFRGLLEFSRPSRISVSINRSERTFELFVGTDQAAAVTEYLELNQKLLIQEIKFKKSLKTILRFEESIRVEQARLYRELQALAH